MYKLEKLLSKIQMYMFSKGSDKEFCMYDRIGNKIQDMRTYIIGKEEVI